MIANHLWQSTLFAFGVWLITLALRQNAAAVRHRLWLIASIKFLIPFSAIASMGQFIPVAMTEASIFHPVPAAIVRLSEPFPTADASMYAANTTLVPATSSWWPIAMTALTVLWAVGVAVGVALWTRRWLELRRLARESVPADLDFPVRALFCRERLEPGVFGIFRPVLLLPAGIADRLTAGQLNAVLAHERSHIRRRDNLTAAIHTLVEVIFWFHPLVWLIKSRLLEEQERSCDEEVLRVIGDPQAYAEAILRICDFYLTTPFGVAGMTGADLKKRIREIMKDHERMQLSTVRLLLLAVAAGVAVAVPLVLGAVHGSKGTVTTAWESWTQAANARPRETFEVASIRPSDPSAQPSPGTRGGGGGPCTSDVTQLSPGRLTISNATLFSLISMAYGQNDCMRSSKFGMISGGPDWIRTQKFTILATTPEGFPNYTLKQVREGEAVRLQAMLQALLEDRFKLVMRRQNKDVPVYELIPARGGVKLEWNRDRASEGAERTKTGDCENVDPSQIGNGMQLSKPFCGSRVLTFAGQPARSWLLRMTGATMQHLASMLEISLERPIVDRTGLTGTFNLQFTFAFDDHTPQPSGAPGVMPVEPDPTAPSLFTALQERIGLKLEPARTAINIWVIDHAERPVP